METIPRSGDAILGLLAAGILLAGAVLWSARGPHVEKTDFSLTYVGAKIVQSGMGDRLYDLSLQKQVRDSIFLKPNPLFFEHPPFEALLLSPLARFPFRTAYMVWGFTNVAVLLLLIVLLRRHLPWPREDLGYISLWLLFAPLGVALYQGQSSILVLLSYATSFLLLRTDNDFGAGLSLGFGLFKFQFILAFVLILSVQKRWRLMAGFASTSAFLAVLSLIAAGRNGLISYVRLLTTVNQNPQNLSYGSAVDMPTIHGFLYAVSGNYISRPALEIGAATVSLTLLLFVAIRSKRDTRVDTVDSTYAAGIAASLLAGSHMFTHDFSPLLLSMFLLASFLQLKRHPYDHSSLRLTAVLAPAVLWTPPVYFVLVASHRLYLMCPVLLVFVLSATLIANCAKGQSDVEVQALIAG
jgi:hypothetical protein